MESSSGATSTSPTAALGVSSPSPSEEKKREQEMVHKTKVIQFLGRTTPIILQNDNGPCPLLAICMFPFVFFSFFVFFFSISLLHYLCPRVLLLLTQIH